MTGYIMILEDGQMFQANKIEDGDINAVEDSLLDIIHIDDMTYLYNNVWNKLPVWGSN